MRYPVLLIFPAVVTADMMIVVVSTTDAATFVHSVAPFFVKIVEPLGDAA